jgi:hypothetical protein
MVQGGTPSPVRQTASSLANRQLASQTCEKGAENGILGGSGGQGSQPNEGHGKANWRLKCREFRAKKFRNQQAMGNKRPVSFI